MRPPGAGTGLSVVDGNGLTNREPERIVSHRADLPAEIGQCRRPLMDRFKNEHGNLLAAKMRQVVIASPYHRWSGAGSAALVPGCCP